MNNEVTHSLTTLLNELEQQLTAQASLASEQDTLIQQLTNENQNYKQRLQQLTTTLENTTKTATQQHNEYNTLIARLMSENEMLTEHNSKQAKQLEQLQASYQALSRQLQTTKNAS